MFGTHCIYLRFTNTSVCALIFSQLLVLTDGQPNIVPPKGHLQELRKYFQANPTFTCQLETFGFGYSVDSKLLLELAQEGGGTYAFISDAPMVGNVFTRALANVLTTHSQRAMLCIKPTNGATIPSLARDSGSSCSPTLHIGPLQYGQYREIIVPVEMPSDCSAPFLDVTLEYGDPVQRISLEADEREVDGGALSVEVAMLRAQFVDTCAALLKQKPLPCAGGAEPLMRALMQRFESSDAAGDERVAAMYADIVGRMSKAMDGADRFKRWGSHYIRGLLRAYELQQCTKCVNVFLITVRIDHV